MNTNLNAEDRTTTCDHCIRYRRQLAQQSRHWLLDAVYGRELLKHELRLVRPDLQVPTWSEPEELEPLLDHMIDMLGVRGWHKPAGLRGRFRYLRTVLRMMVAVRKETELPSW